MFLLHAFLLLCSYYVLRTLREPLLLANGSAELKSYAYATVAVVLLGLIPLYSAAFRRVGKARLSRCVTIFFIANLALFYAAGRLGLEIGFAYYVWVGVFNVTILAQFWAHAADTFNVESGQRLFPAIMIAATLGALAGPPLASRLFSAFGPWPLLLVAIGILVLTLPLAALSRQVVPEESRSSAGAERKAKSGSCGSALGGFSLLLHDRYLQLLALLMVLLNCVNTTGEYLLADLVIRYADAQLAADPSLEKGVIIAAFYGQFYFWVNLLTASTQLLLVARLFRWIGVRGALLVLPVIALLGYICVAFVPVFGVLRLVKVLENSADYSVMSTSRHALYLPLSATAKYEGKITVETFFYRCGDLLQAGIVFVGLNWLGLGFGDFALLNALLAAAWLAVAVALGRRYSALAPQGPRYRAPRLRPIVLAGNPARAAAVALDSRRGVAVFSLTAALAAFTLCLPAPAEASHGGLFAATTTLELDVDLDLKALCRNPERRKCEDLPATFTYRDGGGLEHRIAARLRTRGRYRLRTGDCDFPALFVYFDGGTAQGTLFDGQTMLPLTTHCQNRRPAYDQYVLKEYLAYRIYNLMTEKSLRVRLVRATYRDTSGRNEPMTRYGFFTEHFESLAERNAATVFDTERFDPRDADSRELAAQDVFQYMIGNTDWSVIYPHNIVLIKDSAGLVTPVPYDFDFSGLVDAAYAGPPPQLPITDVRQRIFRGFCTDITRLGEVLSMLNREHGAITELFTETAGLTDSDYRIANDYLDGFFGGITDPNSALAEFERSCR